MSLNKNKPITYEMTPSAAKAVNSTLNGGFFTPVTGVEEQEGINAWEPLEASTSTGYLPDVTSREGQSLINKWAGKALIGSMTPEQIEALPRDYSKRVKDRIRTKGLVGEINRGQNTFANKAFEWGVPTMLSIAGLGPTVSLASNVGWLPTAGILGGGIAGSYGLSTGLGWLGKQIDERNRTNGEYSNYEAIGGLIGGIGGGVLGGLGANRALYGGINKSYVNQTNFRNLFAKDYVDDALSFYHNRQLKDLANWQQRMNKPFKYETTVKDVKPQLNLVDDTVIEYKGTELPESAFISTKNPLDDIVINRDNPQFIKDYNTALKIKAVLNRGDLNKHRLGNIEQLKAFLIKEGVSEDLLTKDVLNKLINARYADYSPKPGYPQYTLRRTSEFDKNNYYYRMNRDGNEVGYINIYDERSIPTDPNISYNAKPGVGVQMIENTTIPDPFRPDRAVINAKGVGEQGYNAVIGDLGEVRTGVNYQSPWATTKTVAKYNTKNYLGDWGVHHYPEGPRTGPVYDLLVPTYHEPVKYLDMFGVNGIDDTGHFVVDFTKGPTYKNGGKIDLPTTTDYLKYFNYNLTNND